MSRAVTFASPLIPSPYRKLFYEDKNNCSSSSCSACGSVQPAALLPTTAIKRLLGKVNGIFWQFSEISRLTCNKSQKKRQHNTMLAITSTLFAAMSTTLFLGKSLACPHVEQCAIPIPAPRQGPSWKRAAEVSLEGSSWAARRKPKQLEEFKLERKSAPGGKTEVSKITRAAGGLTAEYWNKRVLNETSRKLVYNKLENNHFLIFSEGGSQYYMWFST